MDIKNISTERPLATYLVEWLVYISDKRRFCFMARNHSILSPIDSVKDDNQWYYTLDQTQSKVMKKLCYNIKFIINVKKSVNF